jgi:vacuolar-type H+-ATPase subunit I/STV1
MNLLGKIFVVMIVIMSLVFLGLAMAVYSAHKNWPAQVAALQKQAADTQSQLEQQISVYQQAAENLDLEKTTYLAQMAKLESERVALLARNDDMQAEVNDLKQQNRDATAAVTTTQQMAQEIAKANVGLQKDIISTQAAADKAFDETVQATSSLHEASTQLAAELERNQQLTEQSAEMTRVMVNAGLDPSSRSDDVTPKVEGFISGVKRNAGDETIEITIGYDAGIRRNHTVEIYRGDIYVGRAIVHETSPNRAVARVIPESKVRFIEEGDNVATRLSLK